MYLFTILILTILVPTIVSIFFFKKLDLKMKIFSEFLIFKSVSEIFFIITAFSGINNILCVHFYTIIELIYLFLFFRTIYPKLKWIFIALISTAFIYCCVYYNDFNLLIRIIEAVFITSILVYGLVKEQLEDLMAISVGLLYYFGFGIVLFSEMYIKSSILLYVAQGHIILGVFCNALYTYGILDSINYFSKTKSKLL